MFRTLVVPVDGSALAERALPYAIRLAQAGSGRIILMRAAIAPAPRSLDGSEWQRDQAHAIAEAEEYLDQMAESVSGQVSAVESVASYGRPAALILETAARYQADGIVMATHGRTGFAHLLSGSVREAVLANGELPVFVAYARPGEAPPPAFSPYTARVLVPQNFSNDDAPAYPRARVPGQDRCWAARSTRSDSCQGADLIVMATHGRTGLRRAILGSVAGTVLRTGSTPVLLVHPHGQWSRNQNPRKRVTHW